MKRRLLFALLLLAAPICVSAQFDTNIPDNIIWKEISAGECASMPFGNGSVAGNVWTEKDGTYIYLARNDSFSELGRLLKIGRLKLSVDPCVWDFNFSETLDFATGRILIENPYITLSVFSDSEYPVVWIRGKLKSPSKVSLKSEIWRKGAGLHEGADSSGMFSPTGFPNLPFHESADVSVPGGFYHHNDSSIFRLTMQNNRLDTDIVPDPFAGRTFGALMSSPELHAVDGGLESDGLIDEFVVKVAVISTIGDWEKESLLAMDGAGDYRRAEKRTKIYWQEFWDRSYIFVSTPDSVSGKKITEAYNCQRWMTAIAGRSEYPIKFNGSIFTLQGPGTVTPDSRDWGECYWWQNTRLPYYSMVKTGDWDILRYFFDFNKRLMPVFRAQAAAYHGARGATIPEIITQFGTFPVNIFGYGAEKPQHEAVRSIMQQSLDLTWMMLDYVRYSGDERFLAETVVPMAEEFLDFFITRNSLDADGKMRILETQALETYRSGIEDDAPTITGLHAVIRDFRSLPHGVRIPASLEKKLAYLEKVVPDIAVRKDSLGRELYCPAGKYDEVRENCENPELMVVFPFRLSTFLLNAETGRNTFNQRIGKFEYGWPQDGQVAAILGLTDSARVQLLSRVDNTNPAYKFPSYYGPNFDWVPDQCHGGNLMTTLQEMVMQCYDNKVYLLPAFPKDWNVRFRLAAPGGNFVWGEYLRGKWYTKPHGEKHTQFVLK